MRIPKKSLREKSLIKEKLVGNSSSETWYVRFIGHNELKSGFYIKLDPEGHFPKLLAKISAGSAVFKTSFQGSRSAKEYLVFDEHDNITGIVFIAPPNFESFHFSSEEQPTDNSAKEQAIPSKAMLVEHNVMETLLARWFFWDDNPHPHNLGLDGDIDFSMFWYWFVIYMKEARPGIIPQKSWVNLTERDYERFPCVKDFTPYHWPTYTHPGQESITSVLPEIVQKKILSTILPSILSKVYADPEQFVRLAGDPVAQEQKVLAALKILLTYQPTLLRRRLTDIFGDMTLDYTSLNHSLRAKYEEEFPFLCNEKTDKDTFVNFMMTLYHQHYHNLYRVVVFYMGCENNGFGISLMATNIELYENPSLYRKIYAWAVHENATTYAHDPSDQYNLGELKNQYHRVWRDSYTPRLKVLRDASICLTENLCKLVAPHGKIERQIDKETSERGLTSALQLLGSLADILVNDAPYIKEKSSSHNALMLMIQFTNEFQHVIRNYYTKIDHDLVDKDNYLFIRQLEELCRDYEYDLMEALEHTPNNMDEFLRIIRELKQCIQQANFTVHLLAMEEQSHDVAILNRKMEPVAPNILLPGTRASTSVVDKLAGASLDDKTVPDVTQTIEKVKLKSLHELPTIEQAHRTVIEKINQERLGQGIHNSLKVLGKVSLFKDSPDSQDAMISQNKNYVVQ
ncbi:hypothetical protein [Legionella drancourtii]|uniref:Uncharacterized protein n=1 Tax=Legionella drancourtii LLAP12 TaxID=658187 RepID=G9EK71_9GAMM|nr:hypothetical protein [Legionella drancourtii]EHL32222.1 hypothetical protein LDG_5594 [Legionella drancourtii LLAP12]